MNIKELIEQHKGQLTVRDLHELVQAALAELDDSTITYEAVRRWTKGIDPPGTQVRAIALARALKIDEQDVFNVLGWSHPVDDLHARVTHIETLLKDRGLWKDPNVEPATGETMSSLLKIDNGIDDDFGATSDS